MTRTFPVAILGGGPAGLVAALTSARHVPTALVLDLLPTAKGAFRIDSIPAQTLALLSELGVAPHDLGVTSLHRGRWSSWECETPTWRTGQSTAHIERPRLEQALFALACSAKELTIIQDRERPRFSNGFAGGGWRSERLIDATGRRAICARVRVRLDKPWGSCFFWSRKREQNPDFRIAALPAGYVYRLGSHERIGVGLAGRGHWLNASPIRIAAYLHEHGAGWILEGIDLAAMHEGASGTCSVQWTSESHAISIGDAAIARDSLSSQGLAASTSDAMHAVTSGLDSKRLRVRHNENLAKHLDYLGDVLRLCRFRGAPLWRSYETFVVKNSKAAQLNAANHHPHRAASA